MAVVPKAKFRDAVLGQAREMLACLTDAGVRARLDDSDRTPGFKYNFWEMKGVPLRLEVGPRDVDKRACMLARRDRPGRDGKESIAFDSAAFVDDVRDRLDAVQARLPRSLAPSLARSLTGGTRRSSR